MSICGFEIAALLKDKTGQDVRVTVPGHTQRGGEPCAYDRVLATRIGAAGAKLIQEKKYGYMVVVKNQQIIEVPLEDIAGRLKRIEPDAPEVQDAKRIGICFGDEV